jgi:hypothetical protein
MFGSDVEAPGIMIGEKADVVGEDVNSLRGS